MKTTSFQRIHKQEVIFTRKLYLSYICLLWNKIDDHVLF
jgi:hypothetical protein